MSIINKILCKLGIHDLEFENEWYPNFSAKIVTKWVHITRCRRCGYEDIHTWDYEEWKKKYELT